MHRPATLWKPIGVEIRGQHCILETREIYVRNSVSMGIEVSKSNIVRIQTTRTYRMHYRMRI